MSGTFWIRLAAGVMAGLLIAYAALHALAWRFQDRLVFQPSGVLEAPSDYGLEGVEVHPLFVDGVTLTTWRKPPVREGLPTIVYLHGNGSHLGTRAFRFRRFLDRGWGLAALSWPGYSGSGGHPGEAALRTAALAFFDSVAADTDVNTLIGYGESLGTGPIVFTAAEREFRAIILEAPYSSVVDVATEHWRLLGARWLIRHPFRAISAIGQVDEPLLWLHGRRDYVVPFRFGQRLFDAAPGPKRAATYRAGGHNNLYDLGAFDAVEAFVDGVMRGDRMAAFERTQTLP